MSLLDDARELSNVTLETLTRSGTIVCAVCFKRPHGTGCPVLSLPRIVAALEAAERLVARFDDYDFPPGSNFLPADIRRRIEDVGLSLSGED